MVLVFPFEGIAMVWSSMGRGPADKNSGFFVLVTGSFNTVSNARRSQISISSLLDVEMMGVFGSATPAVCCNSFS